MELLLGLESGRVIRWGKPWLPEPLSLHLYCLNGAILI